MCNTVYIAHLVNPLASEATPLIRPGFRCTEIVKYYTKLSPSKEATSLKIL